MNQKQSPGQQQGSQQRRQGQPKPDQHKKDPDPRVGYPNGIARDHHPDGMESDEDMADGGTAGT